MWKTDDVFPWHCDQCLEYMSKINHTGRGIVSLEKFQKKNFKITGERKTKLIETKNSTLHDPSNWRETSKVKSMLC